MRLENLRELVLLKKKPLLALAVLLVTVTGLYVYISAYQWSVLEELRESWMAKRKQQAEGGPASMATVHAQGVRDLAVFYGRVPHKREFARMLSDIYENAANNGLSLKTVGYKPVVEAGTDLMAYQLNLNLVGRYAAVKSFISDVQRMSEIVTIDSLALSGAGPTQESIELKVQLSAYFRTDGQ